MLSSISVLNVIDRRRSDHPYVGTKSVSDSKLDRDCEIAAKEATEDYLDKLRQK